MLRPRTSRKDQHTKGENIFEISQMLYAKTSRTDSGEIVPGLTVFQHCYIVGMVALKLSKRFLPYIPVKLTPEQCGFVAALHDIGKINPAFQTKIIKALSRPDAVSQKLPRILELVDPSMEKNWGYHYGVSQITLEAINCPRYVPYIAGQHHGYTPAPVQLSADAEVLGGPLWQKERLKTVKSLKEAFGIEEWPDIDSPETARFLAGLTTVADWIGSGEDFDGFASNFSINDIGALAEHAIDKAGFINPRVITGLNFEDIFKDSSGKGLSPYEVQQKFIDVATSSGVHVLEAPMGSGKTEAALYAAYRLMEVGKARGIYFALPTRLTSNKIYDRFNSFIQRILKKHQTSIQRALLLHGLSWLERTELGIEGEPGGSWFDTRKRGLLAPFGVGTLDQALMAVMNVRHGFVRAFGLSGKVVILDEVHSYDSYTGAIIDALIPLLRNLGCTVFILSATLTRERRAEVIGTEIESNAFPLVSSSSIPGECKEYPIAPPQELERKISLTFRMERKELLEMAIERAQSGFQVLWIENTVPEAQSIYYDFAARCKQIGVECGLLHSRFTLEDRKHNEEKWVSLYGKSGINERSLSGRVLIGTQVLEQSLDIDADLLITSFCPTDMLFQRLGRLWRHTNTPRPSNSVPEAWVITPPYETAIEDPLKAFGPTALVYAPYVLCRSLEVWCGRKEVALPDDVRPLLDATYTKRHEKGAMAKWLHELENGTRFRKGRKELRQLARFTLSRDAMTLPESKAQTRYGEEPGCDVLLLRDIRLNAEKDITEVTLLNEKFIELPLHKSKLSREGWRRLSVSLMKQTVNVRLKDAPLPLKRSFLKRLGLDNCLFIGSPEDDEALLRLAIVDETGQLHGIQGAKLHNTKDIFYRPDTGYRVVKRQKR